MPQPPLRVLIAGCGVAGLETLMALHALAGDRVELTVVAPGNDFVYRPLATKEPYAVGRTRQVPLDRAARDADATLFPLTIESVDTRARIVSTVRGRQFEYDALVLAVGADAVPEVPHAMTWDDRSAADTLGGLLQDFEQGYSHSLAVIIPPGPVWPLRAYELALLITLDARGMGYDAQTTIITPEPSPLAHLGPLAIELVSKELERAGVGVVSADRVEIEQDHRTTVVLQPSGQRLEVDRVLALPGLRGRRLAGVPTDGAGFIDVDERCRVRGVDDVWGIGDCTAFPVKSGGFAAEQADIAAEDIAAHAGAAIEPRLFDPAREGLAGLPSGRFLTEWLGAGEDEELTTHLPGTGGLPVLTYLQRDFEAGFRGVTEP
jgi:sulfide:quinone oxidoreductase